MEYLLVYDINTEDAAGERRLRRVAKICEGFGHRVQKSVFECDLDPAHARLLIHRLAAEIDASVDRVAMYRLREPHQRYVRTLGVGPELDWRGPVVL